MRVRVLVTFLVRGFVVRRPEGSHVLCVSTFRGISRVPLKLEYKTCLQLLGDGASLAVRAMKLLYSLHHMWWRKAIFFEVSSSSRQYHRVQTISWDFVCKVPYVDRLWSLLLAWLGGHFKPVVKKRTANASNCFTCKRWDFHAYRHAVHVDLGYCIVENADIILCKLRFSMIPKLWKMSDYEVDKTASAIWKLRSVTTLPLNQVSFFKKVVWWYSNLLLMFQDHPKIYIERHLTLQRQHKTSARVRGQNNCCKSFNNPKHSNLWIFLAKFTAQ